MFDILRPTAYGLRLFPERPIWSILSIIYFVLSRLAYVFGVGVALHRQDREQYYTARYGVEGGFARFRRMASWIMNNDGVAFVVLCFATRQTFPSTWPILPLQLLGVVIALFGIAVKVWAARTLGSAGYYWYNFFSTEPAAPLTSPGPYRYIDNPMYTVGYLPTYGLALLLSSLPGLIGAAFAQVGVLAFNHFVEKPHWDRVKTGRES